MRLCERNLRTFYYCTYEGRVEIGDDGHPMTPTSTSIGTGEYVDKYSSAIIAVGNIGGVKGTSNSNPFGIMEDYDRTIILEDTSCPITSSSVLFLDKEPSFDPSGVPEFDYYVVKAGSNLGYFYILAKKR